MATVSMQTTVKLPPSYIAAINRPPIRQAEGLQIQDRDLKVLLGVYTHDRLTKDQIVQLFFEGKYTTQTKRRLKKLFQNNYLQRAGKPWQPLVYSLTAEGYRLLSDHRLVPPDNWKKRHKPVSDFFLPHHIWMVEVRLAFERSAQLRDWQIPVWIDDATMRRRYRMTPEKVPVEIKGPTGKVRVEPVPFIPDSYFVVDTGEGQYHCFLEIDRGTTEAKRWENKVKSYLGYRQLGLFQSKYGADRFRVFTVTKDETWVEHRLTTTEQVGGKASFSFAPFEMVIQSDPFGEAIWRQPGRSDLRTAF